MKMELSRILTSATMRPMVYFDIKNQLGHLISCVKSAPSSLTSRPKLEPHCRHFSPPLFLKVDLIEGVRYCQMTEAQAPGKLSPLFSELVFPLMLWGPLSSELTMGKEMRASPKLIFSPISNPDNGESPSEIWGYLRAAG